MHVLRKIRLHPLELAQRMLCDLACLGRVIRMRITVYQPVRRPRWYQKVWIPVRHSANHAMPSAKAASTSLR